jgi:uncharacterized membrane protein
MVLMGSSWIVFRLVWVTVLVAIPVLGWMVFFIVLYPKLVEQSGLLDSVPEGDRPIDFNP